MDPCGRVLGTEDSTPLEFWVAVAEGHFLQLDDVVAVERTLPGLPPVRVYGVVNQVRARHEGSRFDSDVFLIAQGLLPAEVCEAAKIMVTRCEPEIFVPPTPGQPVFKATGEDREKALYFDDMVGQLPIGLSRENEPIYASLEYIDGTKGAHVNISGISGVATKTSYALFLLYSLFNSGVLGMDAMNSKALVFNVKGEDLLFLDKPNVSLKEEERVRYAKLGLKVGPFNSVSFWAPPRKHDRNASPDVNTRLENVTSFFWTLKEFCTEGLLQFLFADVDDERQQYTMVAQNVMSKLRQAEPTGQEGAVNLEGRKISTFADLVDLISELLDDDQTRAEWAGRAMGSGTCNAFVRRLQSSKEHVGHLIRADRPNSANHLIHMQNQVTVVDIHSLNDRAQRFVVGIMLKRTMEQKERQGQARPLWFVVLDELNKYAPREGTGPIKETLVDIAERGRSLGMVLVGAQQTASEVERRITGMAAIRVVGRLDSAEALRPEYGFLKGALQARSTILKSGTMIALQPLVPTPLVLEFPFPAWATRKSEVAPDALFPADEDPFSKF